MKKVYRTLAGILIIVASLNSLSAEAGAATFTEKVVHGESGASAERSKGPVWVTGGSEKHQLDITSRILLSRFILNQYPTIPLTLVAKPGLIRDVASVLEKEGGKVYFMASDIDYLRGSIPTKEAQAFSEKIEVFAIRFGIQRLASALDVDPLMADPPGDYPLPHEKAEVASDQKPLAESKPTPVDVSSALDDLSPLNPYFPSGAIGAPQFIKEHPSFDGRGVTIAVFEGVGDLNHPMLQTGRLLDGTITPKIVDILDPRTSAEVDYEDGTTSHREGFLKLEEVSTGENDAFSVGKNAYVAPQKAHYEFGIEPTTGLAMLWDRRRDVVWVDVNRDGKFRDSAKLADFSRTGEIVRFPSISAGFDSSLAVKTDPNLRTLKVYLSTDSHHTAVATIAAGTNIMGSEATGVAPGSRVIFVVPQEESPVESFLMAAKDPRVDLITCSGWCYEDSGEGVDTVALSRIIRRYRKPILLPAGDDGPIAASLGPSGFVEQGITVGTYSDKAGEDIVESGPYRNEEAEYINEISNSGPGENGALKPDVVAPSLTVAGVPCSMPPIELPRYEHVKSVHCYWMGNGMASFATPMAAGGVALLISAAKQMRIPFDNERIKMAIESTAHHLDNWPLERQGGGLLQVGAAWETLRKAGNGVPTHIIGRARISPPNSDDSASTVWGTGILEWNGWHPGDEGVRRLLLYRANGSSKPIRYQIEWLENDGTFESPSDVTLALGKETEVPVRIHPKRNGLHASILRLIRADDRSFGAQFGAYVVAADLPGKVGSGALSASGVVSRNRSSSVFVDVPHNTSLLTLSLTQDRGVTFFRTWRPDNFGDRIFRLAVPIHSMTRAPGQATEGSMLIPLPRPGVWQLLLQPDPDDSSQGGAFPTNIENTHFHLEARIVKLTPSESSMIWPGEIGSKGELGGIFTRVQRTGAVYEDSLGDSTNGRSFLGVEVPTRISELRVSLGSAASKGVPNLYLYHCQAGHWRLWIQRHGADSRDIVVRQPAAGTWVVAAEKLNDRPWSEFKLRILEVNDVPSKHQPVDSVASALELPAFVRHIEPSWFKPVTLTEYFDEQEEHREFASPLNDVRYYWNFFRPSALAYQISPVKSEP